MFDDPKKELKRLEDELLAAEMTDEELKDYCMALPRYKRPHVVIFADIPRNPTGKIEKPKLREIYGATGLVADQNRG